MARTKTKNWVKSIRHKRFKNGNWIIVATSVCTDRPLRYVGLHHTTPHPTTEHLARRGGRRMSIRHSQSTEFLFYSRFACALVSNQTCMRITAESEEANKPMRASRWVKSYDDGKDSVQWSERRENRDRERTKDRLFGGQPQLLDCCRLPQLQEKSQQKDSRAPAGHLLENWGKCMACQLEATRSEANHIASVPLITIWLFL